MTGANIRMENGLTIPPVKKSKKPSCRVSKSKKENALTLLLDLFFLSSKQEQKFTATDNKIIVRISNNRISILIMQKTIKTAKNCPKIAIHLILIRLPSSMVFIKF